MTQFRTHTDIEEYISKFGYDSGDRRRKDDTLPYYELLENNIELFDVDSLKNHYEYIGYLIDSNVRGYSIGEDCYDRICKIKNIITLELERKQS
jgi:hypothetical protein